MRESICAALTCACLLTNMPFNPKQASAVPFPKAVAPDPVPLFQQVERSTITIALQASKQTPDPADIYVPSTPATPKKFPIVLLLQGALVDKSAYSTFATEVARYGFIVVVPNHTRSLTAPNGQTISGLASEQQQVNDVLKQMIAENANPKSRLANRVDITRLGLLGHSFGGYVGLGAIQNRCFPGVCTGSFTRPPALKAGIFYGTNFRTPPITGTFPMIANQNIPTALIAGSLDGVSTLDETQKTYRQIQTLPKALIVVKGANHYGITNEDNPRDPSRPTLTQTQSNTTIARWSAWFLRAHLLNDPVAFDRVYKQGNTYDSNVSVTSAK
ncbi:chlorophyllase [Leptolyngbya sp. FACHB-17]|uniref:alpha/beta hydrolase family protein n=1 Tax=unclassified Leptolyngbya TaxID=2650499 RepID=UPI0018EFDB46|nr:chlorophyllase [Leptolyngbya sp. FACHB-17]